METILSRRLLPLAILVMSLAGMSVSSASAASADLETCTAHVHWIFQGFVATANYDSPNCYSATSAPGATLGHPDFWGASTWSRTYSELGAESCQDGILTGTNGGTTATGVVVAESTLPAQITINEQGLSSSPSQNYIEHDTGAHYALSCGDWRMDGTAVWTAQAVG
jgi:hypothetical protein